jgi:hypothetical protein
MTEIVAKPRLSEADFNSAAAALDVEVAVIKAVTEVESRGSGFNPDGSPITLFEGHVFSRYTKGKFDASNPTLSYPRWTRQFYGKNWQAEQLRLQQAMALDRQAALMSASWGLFQIMGFNFALAGHKTLQSFVNAMYRSEGAQLDAFVQYIIQTSLGDELRDKRFADFARKYNGPDYKKNQYDVKLNRAYAKFSR